MSHELKSYYLDHAEKKPEWSKRKISLFSATTSIIFQLKSGTDMTKLSLPAVFLNPYSALEISSYRNSLQLPVLAGINKEEDSEQRFLRIVSWYLAGLKQEDFEKKPYNPILGELHKVEYESKDLGKSSFLAEQVSHHPPIANYRVHCPKEQITISGSAEFSVSWRLTWAEVKTKGYVNILLENFDEEYNFNLIVPDLHITNIIGWGAKHINWMGTVTVSCPKTGYEAQMIFSEKTTDYGYKNVMAGEITTPSNLTYEISGEVGGIATLKKSKSEKEETFFDPNKYPRANIIYPDRFEADPLESLAIWDKVSQAIIDNDMNTADNEKRLIEEAQRKRRAEKKDIKPRYFMYDDYHKKWVWKVPTKRGIYTLKKQIKQMEANNEFEHEYMQIEHIAANNSDQLVFSAATNPVHRPLNRYSNVLPPDHTRVKLNKDIDYINANFINGLIPNSEKRYIATQGPLESTFADFWMMIWEQNVSVILMLTREVENGRIKCERYWPEEKEEGSAKYGDYQVKFKTSETLSGLLHRKFDLVAPNGESREINHFQYIDWPDHGLPPSTTSFLDLLHRAENCNTNKGPFVVHCSAGIGRTGTFCTVHAIVEQIQHSLSTQPEVEPKVDFIQTISNMRQQRPGLIQTKDQYQFCFLALSEEVDSILTKLNKPIEKLDDPSSSSSSSSSSVPSPSSSQQTLEKNEKETE